MDLRETLREQLGKTGRMLLGVTGDVTEEEGAARLIPIWAAPSCSRWCTGAGTPAKS